MKVFSKRINIEAGQPLGGYMGERLSSEANDTLELNGLAFNDSKSGIDIELCTLDALYAGNLVDKDLLGTHRRIYAASHTHYAPMLDGSKPQIGAYSYQAIKAWEEAIHSAPRKEVKVERCNIYRAEVPVPIYRRFDFPDTAFNRFLTAKAGMYPNGYQQIDRNLYIFEFGNDKQTEFVIVLHCCHPVSRSDRSRTSSDYVDVLRTSLRARFGDVPCLFLLGCSGDIRPNFARKRFSFLPKGRLNWCFERQVPLSAEQNADRSYMDAVKKAQIWQSFELSNSDVRFATRKLSLTHQGEIELPSLLFGDRLIFVFFPFEVSHLFHLDAQNKDPMHFIVSCSDHTFGYLPHPSQINAGGYEVDGSRSCMGLPNRVLLNKGAL